MKFFNLIDIKKAYTEGIYADTPANRKLGRVGMSYAEYNNRLKEYEEIKNEVGKEIENDSSYNENTKEFLKDYSKEMLESIKDNSFKDNNFFNPLHIEKMNSFTWKLEKSIINKILSKIVKRSNNHLDEFLNNSQQIFKNTPSNWIERYIKGQDKDFEVISNFDKIILVIKNNVYSY